MVGKSGDYNTHGGGVIWGEGIIPIPTSPLLLLTNCQFQIKLSTKYPHDNMSNTISPPITHHKLYVP
jgi:hypothetical protein